MADKKRAVGTKGEVVALLKKLEGFATTPSRGSCPKGKHRVTFHEVAAQAARTGIAPYNVVGLTQKQQDLVNKGRPANSMPAQRKKLAKRVADAAQELGVPIPSVVTQRFGL